MAFWILDQWYDELDYPALGFVAQPEAILEADYAPDPRWSSTLTGPETVTRYGTGTGDPSYTEPGDGHILAWSDDDNAYMPTAPDEFLLEAGVGVFAAKSAQDTIELGRLEETVLARQFGRDTVWIGAGRMHLASGSPSSTPLGGEVAGWRLDAGSDEAVVCSEEMHPSVATFDVWAVGANVSSGTGSLRVRCLHNLVGDGDEVTANDTTDAVTFAAAAQNVRQSVKISSGLTNDPTKIHTFRFLRDADDDLDSLGNDWHLMGVRLVATSWVTFEPEVPPEEEDITGQAFTQADNDFLGGLEVWHNADPPDDDSDDEGYQHFPATGYFTTQDFTDSEWSLGNKGPFVWANRYNVTNETDGEPWNSKPNILPSPQIDIGNRNCRAVFTTMAKANAATRAQVRHLIGMSTEEVEEDWIAAGGASGVDFVAEADFRLDPETYCDTAWTHKGKTYQVMVDKVLLPTPRMVDGFNPELNTLLVLDYEVQDGRSEATTTAFLTALADDIQGAGREFMVYTNALTTTTQVYTGISSTNLPAILDAVDYLSVFLWSKPREGSVAASWDAQIAAIGTITTPEWSKIFPIFELGTTPGTTLADAEWLYDKLHEPGTDHPTRVMFWRNGSAPGGSLMRLHNQKISMVCFGTANWNGGA